MREYEFELIFTLQDPNEDSEAYVEALGSNNCTDALVGTGRKGRIALDFGRNAESAYEAIASAIFDVMRSIPGVTLAEVKPDLVGITDVAELVGRSRQNIRKLIFSEGSGCPPPVHSDNPALWNLYDILLWLQQNKGYEIRQELIDVAEITKSLNVLRIWNQIDLDMQRQAIIVTKLGQKELAASPL